MMARFAFRLQSVLDYRENLVDRARMELAAMQSLLRDAEETLDALQQAEREGLDELAAAQRNTTLDLPDITRLLEYIQAVGERIVEQRELIVRRRQDVEAQ